MLLYYNSVKSLLSIWPISYLYLSLSLFILRRSKVTLFVSLTKIPFWWPDLRLDNLMITGFSGTTVKFSPINALWSAEFWILLQIFHFHKLPGIYLNTYWGDNINMMDESKDSQYKSNASLSSQRSTRVCLLCISDHVISI